MKYLPFIFLLLVNLAFGQEVSVFTSGTEGHKSYRIPAIIASAFLFGFGFGMFDTNNMPILCQFVQPNQRATGYGFLNTAGIFAGALITDYLGKSTDAGNLGKDFAMLAFVVVIVLIIQLIFLKPYNTNAVHR